MGKVDVPPPPLMDAARGGAAQDASPEQSALSRSQQKKQRVREIRKERKGQKKVRKQADAMQAALNALDGALQEGCQVCSPEGGDETPGPLLQGYNDLACRLCCAFRRHESYRALPRAFGPKAAEGMAKVGSVLVRPPKYSEKFLPQEYSLLHKLWALVGSGDLRGTGVVDIGAGNANCAVLASSLLGLTVICVERESPREELRAEMQLPPALRRRVVRIEADVADFSAEQLRELAVAHGLKRVAIIAKHPCGIGCDRSIECAARIVAKIDREECEVLGAVLATCCTNKLSMDDAQESRVREFCTTYASDLPAFTGGGSLESLERVVDTMSRCSSWRTASQSLGNAISDEQLAWAELFEDTVQSLRLRRLERIFGHVCEVRFAPASCTLQDRCLIASTRPLPKGVWAHEEAAEDDGFIDRLSSAAEALLSGSGPMDCRPKGLKSDKYGFDYTDLAPPGD